MSVVLIILAILCLLIGIVFCVLPAIPGPPFAYLGLWLAQWSIYYDFPLPFMIWTGVAMVVVSVIDAVLPPVITKTTGGSRYATVGSIVGMIAGILFTQVGMILGMIVGAFLGELMFARQSTGKAFKAAWGAFAGFLLGTGLKLFYCFFLIYKLIFPSYSNPSMQPTHYTDQELESKGYHMQVFELKPDYDGNPISVLISKPCPEPSQKAVLYVHGYNDYFFQDHMADWYLSQGYNFYALELRRYGRAWLPNQVRYAVRNLNDYYEELDMAVETIRNRDGNRFLLLNGHSTGGLITALYASDRAEDHTVDALFLNSPFLELNASPFVRNVLTPVFCGLGSIFPKMFLPLPVSSNYGKSLHKDYQGEWDYNLEWKPLENKTRAGWLRAIRKAQKRVRKGLSVECPVLVMHSDKSGSEKEWSEDLYTTDVVLNVEHIHELSPRLGKNVTIIEIPHAVHDIILSAPPVRKKVFDELGKWLDALKR